MIVRVGGDRNRLIAPLSREESTNQPIHIRRGNQMGYHLPSLFGDQHHSGRSLVSIRILGVAPLAEAVGRLLADQLELAARQPADDVALGAGHRPGGWRPRPWPR